MSELLVSGRTCWRVETADRLRVIVDAEDYFRTLRAAMLCATHQVLLIGWDFDARITLEGDDDGPPQVGAFFPWLVDRTPGLELYLLRWDVGAIKSLVRGSTVLRLAQWAMHPRIHARLDGHHPTAASHHQKIVVIDDCLAFCGGIDMTAGRWDTRAHRDDDRGRHGPGPHDHDPWHDATTALQGAAAKALGDLARDRWAASGGDPIAAPAPVDACWPDELPVDFADVPIGIARTVPELDDQPCVAEVEALALALIGSAKRWLYIESQYFASRTLAEAIARRLDEPDGPEIVILNPLHAEGWLEPVAMDTARARLVTTLRRRDPHGRLRLYHPYTSGGTPIYVHAKVLVADDHALRVGSSNFNNRSMGLDTECDVALTARNDDDRRRIAAIRDGLVAEHLGVEPELVARHLGESGSLIATIDALRGDGARMRDYEVPDLNAVEQWLADHEVLDPEQPGEVFEATSPTLLEGLKRRLHRDRDG